MSEFVGVMTEKGLQKQAASMGGTAMTPTLIRVGDGNGAPIAPTRYMTDLVHRVGAAYPLTGSGRDPVNPTMWRFRTLIPIGDGPFDIREIGLFDAAGDMLAVARHVLVEKRTPAQGAAIELETEILVPFSETAQVVVTVAPESLVAIDRLLAPGFLVVESASVTAPPANAATGHVYALPPNPTGAWGGLAGKLLQWNGSFWVAITAPVGFVVVDKSVGRFAGRRFLERTATGWEPGLTRTIQKQATNYAVAGGTANAISIVLDPEPDAILEGTCIRLRIAASNTGPVTLSVNGRAAQPVLRADGAALIKDDLVAGEIASILCAATHFQIGARSSQSPPRTTQAFANAGSFNFVVPAGIHKVFARVVGGGGGGAGVGQNAAGGAFAGGAGGAGGYCEGWCDVAPGQTIAVAVGGGGAGGQASANAPSALAQSGATGGSSSFGSFMSATGGIGGSASPTAGGGGGNGFGPLPSKGGFGGDGGGTAGVHFGGSGGASAFGGGGRAAISYDAAVMAGQAYGSGGGSIYAIWAANGAGGDGRAGAVILQW